MNQTPDNEQVNIIAERLMKKAYTQEYNMYVQDPHELSAEFARELREKKLLMDLCKDSSRPRMIENSKMHYLLGYHKECMKHGIHPLPIFMKVRNGRLLLKGYQMNEGLCRSFLDSTQIYP